MRSTRSAVAAVVGIRRAVRARRADWIRLSRSRRCRFLGRLARVLGCQRRMMRRRNVRRSDARRQMPLGNQSERVCAVQQHTVPLLQLAVRAYRHYGSSDLRAQVDEGDPCAVRTQSGVLDTAYDAYHTPSVSTGFGEAVASQLAPRLVVRQARIDYEHHLAAAPELFGLDRIHDHVLVDADRSQRSPVPEVVVGKELIALPVTDTCGRQRPDVVVLADLRLLGRDTLRVRDDDTARACGCHRW